MASEIIKEIEAERSRQDEKWGEQNHDLPVWLAVLTEEVGEVAKAILEARAALPGNQMASTLYIEDLRKELVQVAAVAVAAIEYIDRGSPKP